MDWREVQRSEAKRRQGRKVMADAVELSAGKGGFLSYGTRPIPMTSKKQWHVKKPTNDDAARRMFAKMFTRLIKTRSAARARGKGDALSPLHDKVQEYQERQGDVKYAKRSEGDVRRSSSPTSVIYTHRLRRD